MFMEDSTAEGFSSLIGDSTEPTDVAGMPDVLEGPRTALRDAQARYARIAGLIEQEQAARDAAAAQYATTFEELATAEAASVMDGSQASPAIRKAVMKHSETLLVFDARLSGLRARLTAAQAEVEEGMRALSGAAQAWREAEIDAARNAFWIAAEVFVRAAARPIAIGLGLGDPRLSRLAATVSIPDSEDGGRNSWQAVRSWKDSPQMMAVVRQYGGVKQVVTNEVAAARLAVAAGKIGWRC